MKAPSALYVVAAIINLTIAMVWGNAARNARRQLETQRWSLALMTLLPLLAGSMSFVYLAAAIFDLTPAALHSEAPLVLRLLHLASDIAICVSVALFRHVSRYFALTIREERPTRRWLRWNYGSAAVLIGVVLCDHLMALGGEKAAGVIYQLLLWSYVSGMLALSTRRLLPFARGPWTPGGFAVARRPDVLALLVAVALMVAIGVLQVVGGWAVHRDAMTVLAAVLGVAVVTPFAVRILGEVIRGVLLSYALLASIGVVLLGAAVLDMQFSSDPALRPLVLLLAGGALALVVGPWRDWLETALERVVSRRRRNRRIDLQDAMHELSPELGVAECCRRGLHELAHVMQLRGSAILLRDGGSVVEGDLAIEPLDSVWPRDSAIDHLLGSPFVDYDRVLALPLPVREAMHAADVVRVAAVRGPKRLWGHLVFTTDLVGSTFVEEDTHAIAAFADRLGLLLEAADMLTRVLAVERSLAHSEKLAAIGELAARVAHEIRNPVTAARSLAQLMARDPTSPLNAEHADLILAELQRVERQVAALLRFARRDELALAPVDLGELVRETAEHFQARLEGIDLSLDAAPELVAHADREKLRQALINLVENALDALATQPGERRLALTAEGSNGRLLLAVSDNGPGVPEASVERLFEPFFSLKEHGTGLGLAIVKRTIEAHGGKISATCAEAGGMRFAIELPCESSAIALSRVAS